MEGNKNMDSLNKIIYLDGKLYKVIKTYEGDVDLSYHGSPWYETFIEAEDLETGEIKTFGERRYHWHDAKDYIKHLEDKIKEVKKILY